MTGWILLGASAAGCSVTGLILWLHRYPQLGQPLSGYHGPACGRYSPGIPLGHPEITDTEQNVAWRCSRPTEHDGRHAAAVDDVIVAVWRRQPTDRKEPDA